MGWEECAGESKGGEEVVRVQGSKRVMRRGGNEHTSGVQSRGIDCARAIIHVGDTVESI